MPDKKFPRFTTADLTDEDIENDEMERRWEIYEREMIALIATGTLHQDHDGWWVHTATGELIGTDLDDERPRTEEELAQGRPFAEVFPDLAAKIRESKKAKG